jgi:hypothetical protein
MIASALAAQDSGSPAELENSIGDATTKRPPHALVTPSHVEWDWHRTVGDNTNNKIAYRLDITVGANGTGVADAGIEVTEPSNYPPYYCQAKDWADWRGPTIFDGSSMTFPAGWHNTVDQCNPARNGSYRIDAVTFQWQLIDKNKTLDIIMPFYLGQWFHVRLIKVKF